MTTAAAMGNCMCQSIYLSIKNQQQTTNSLLLLFQSDIDIKSVRAAVLILNSYNSKETTIYNFLSKERR